MSYIIVDKDVFVNHLPDSDLKRMASNFKPDKQNKICIWVDNLKKVKSNGQNSLWHKMLDHYFKNGASDDSYEELRNRFKRIAGLSKIEVIYKPILNSDESKKIVWNALKPIQDKLHPDEWRNLMEAIKGKREKETLDSWSNAKKDQAMVSLDVLDSEMIFAGCPLELDIEAEKARYFA